MGLFGQSSPFDADIDKATSEKNTSEQWGVIMDICDKVASNPKNVKDCLKSIMRRMAHNDPHVVIQAVTLLDACISNCGKAFHLEVASREFENEYKRLLLKAQPQVGSKMRLSLKRWAENEFKSDPQLNLIPSFYQKLKSEGHDFSDTQKAPKPSTPAAALKDPNVVTSEQEEEDIAKAIELSLKDSKSSPKKQSTTSAYSSLYPSFSASSSSLSTTGSTSTVAPEPRKVRALYDFEAAEENELTFVAGEIIHVIDDSDPNWWKGYNQRGEGLFPSNFVTADLSVEPEKFDANLKSKKLVQFEDDAKKDEKTEIKEQDDEKQYVPEINEEKIDRLLHLLHEANPEDPSQDSDEMLRLESDVNRMGSLIDTELERVDRKHAQLTQLSSDLVDAINLYHTLMREDRSSIPHGMPPQPPHLSGPMSYMPNYNQQNMYSHNPMYNAMPVPGMYHQGLPPFPMVSTQPTSMPPIPTMQMIQGSQIPEHATVGQQHPPQISAAPGFNPHPQHVVPIQMQNGHPQSLQQQHHQQQQQHQPQQSHPQIIQQQNRPPLQQPPQQNIQNIPANSIQPVMSQSSLQLQQQQSHHQMQIPNISKSNPNFQPPTFVPAALNQSNPNYSPNLSQMLPGGPYQVPQPQASHHQIIHNGAMGGGGGGGNVMGHQPLGIHNNNIPMSMPQHMAAINQPVTQTILGQNDSKTNIPVYQQQRFSGTRGT